jgi:hypothetical protein
LQISEERGVLRGILRHRCCGNGRWCPAEGVPHRCCGKGAYEENNRQGVNKCSVATLLKYIRAYIVFLIYCTDVNCTPALPYIKNIKIHIVDCILLNRQSGTSEGMYCSSGFQSFWLSSHSSFPVVPTVLSLWLSSGRSELEFLKNLWELGTE